MKKENFSEKNLHNMFLLERASLLKTFCEGFKKSHNECEECLFNDKGQCAIKDPSSWNEDNIFGKVNMPYKMKRMP